MSSVRVTRSPGGDISHNVFSWSDGSEQRRKESPSFPTGIGAGAGQLTFGGDDIVVETTRKRPGHETKLREMTGSGIFNSSPSDISSNAFANNNDQNSGNFITDRPSVRLHQPAGGRSQISFGADEPPVPQRKLLSPFKQLELSGTTETLADVQSRKHFSNSKLQELNGSLAIFKPQPFPDPDFLQEEELDNEKDSSDPNSVRISSPVGGRSQIVFSETSPQPPSRKVSDRLVLDLVGRGASEPEPPLRVVNERKKKDLQGCNIFVDQKPLIRDSLGGVRKPPGGESTITLI